VPKVPYRIAALAAEVRFLRNESTIKTPGTSPARVVSTPESPPHCLTKVFCVIFAYGICQRDPSPSAVHAFSPSVSPAYLSLSAAGKEIARICDRWPVSRSQPDLLDDDSMGFAGEHARIHDQRRAQEGYAASLALV
jgi:hypothetical protein